MSAQPARRNQPSWLDGYVGVDEAVKEFREEYPDARIVTNIVDGYDKLTFRADIFLPSNDGTIPNASGHASVDGGSSSNNRAHSPVEKTEAAAIRRALKWLGYGGKENEDEPASGIPNKPAPVETHTPTDERQRQVLQIHGILKELNANLNRLQQAPIWTKEHLKNYVNKQFEVEDGMDSLNFESLHELHRDLSGQLEALTRKV